MSLRTLSRSLLLAALVAVASSASAATGVDALRGRAAAARQDVLALRQSQLSTRAELGQLSGRIEQLKGQTQGALLPGGELDAALKRSQELSTTLTGLSQQLTAREGELEAANLALLDGLSAELTALRASYERAPTTDARRQVIAQLKKLKLEREQVRAQLPATKVPALDALKPSDDPDELLEQADLLRDNEEKLRKELLALEKRLDEARREREFDRQHRNFQTENFMFDDEDRRFQATRTTTEQTTAPTAAAAQRGSTDNKSADSFAATQTEAGAAAPTSPFANANTAPPSRDTAAAPQAGTADFAPTGGAAPVGGAPDTASVRVTRGSDARPQLGSGSPLAGSDEGGDVEDLELQRFKLKGLAEQLKARAKALEQRAAQLK